MTLTTQPIAIEPFEWDEPISLEIATRHREAVHRAATFLGLAGGLYLTALYAHGVGWIDPIGEATLKTGALLIAILPGISAALTTLTTPSVRHSLFTGACLLFLSSTTRIAETFGLPPFLSASLSAASIRALEESLAVGGVVCLLSSFYFSITTLHNDALLLRRRGESLYNQIRQRIWAEASLLQGASQFRRLAETTSAAILLIQGRKVRYANSAAEALFGYSRDELYQMDVASLFSSDLGLEIKRTARSNEDSPKLPERRETKIITKLGQSRSVDVSAGRISFQKRPAILVTALDITERKRAEQAVAENRDRFRALVQDSSDVIMVLGADKRIWYASPSADKVLDLKGCRDLIGKSLLEIVHADDRAGAQRTFTEVLQSPGRTIASEFRVVRADGSNRILEVVLNNLLDNPSIRGVVLNSRDVTERRQLQRQLRQSQKMEALGRLAGGVAHDFNNLLTTILVRCELLEETPNLDVKRRAEIEEIRKAGERAAGLTRQLLAFSRRETIEKKVVDLNSTITDLKKMLHRLIGEDIQFITRLDAEVGRVKCDPGQIEQVIMNLVVNARDAMPEGGRLMVETYQAEIKPEILRREPDLTPGPHVLLVVSDTGCGMDRETQEHIFEPFFTTKDNDKGTGLGLATVYGIVKQCGGHIEVYSEVGVGTTFHVYLPIVTEEEQEDGKEGATRAGRGTETVLVVEDDPELRKLTRTILERRGYRVLEAESGETALEICAGQGRDIDLMLSDVVMPGASGPATYSEAVKICPRMKVLFMSGYTHDAVVRHGMAEGNMGFLEKPFNSQSLLRKVREVLDTHGQSGEFIIQAA